MRPKNIFRFLALLAFTTWLAACGRMEDKANLKEPCVCPINCDQPLANKQNLFEFVGYADTANNKLSIKRLPTNNQAVTAPSCCKKINSAAQNLTQLPIVQDGVAGTNPVDTIELVNITSGQDLAGGCSANQRFCATVNLRSFFPATYFGHVYVELTSLTPTANHLPTNSDVPPAGSGLSATYGLWDYGFVGRDGQYMQHQTADVQVNTYTTGSQGSPQTISFSDGRFIIFYYSDQQDQSGYGVYGQRYLANATKDGTEFRVNTYTNGSQSGPKAAAFSDGRYVVIWQSDAQDGSGSGIFGQRYLANSNKDGTEFVVNTYTTGTQSSPSVVAFTDGRMAAFWQSDAQDGNNIGVIGQRYLANGDKDGTEFIVNTYTTKSTIIILEHLTRPRSQRIG